MCLIVLKPANVTVSKSWLEDFCSYNQDGFGYMYHNGSELVVFKTHESKPKEVAKHFAKFKQYEAVIHLRMKTHGEINLANAHPYQVLNKEEHGRDLWMVHNGVIRDVANDQKQMSDTWHYIRDKLRPLLAFNPELLNNKAFQDLVAGDIGMSNKFVFMDDVGSITVINDKAFSDFPHAKGVRVSNTYAWTSPRASYNTYGGYGNYGNKYKPRTVVINATTVKPANGLRLLEDKTDSTLPSPTHGSASTFIDQRWYDDEDDGAEEQVLMSGFVKDQEEDDFLQEEDEEDVHTLEASELLWMTDVTMRNYMQYAPEQFMEAVRELSTNYEAVCEATGLDPKLFNAA